ncbi:MAG: T9SS type A sorting domain-containing protein [Bacteroidota bacterium]
MKKNLLFILLCFSYLFSIAQIASNVTVQNHPLCAGLCNGNANLTATGGTMPYTYTIIPSAMTGTFTSVAGLSNLCAGSYTVLVADQSMITTSSVFTMMQPQPLSVFASSNNDCSGTCSGVVYLTAFGGNPPYVYQWSNGSTMPQVTNACAGVYTVQVTDINGCVAFASATVTQSPPINTNLTFTNAVCVANCNGAANSSITGGTAPFSYQWLQTGTGVPVSTVSTVSNLCPGNYTFTTIDAVGCAQTNTFNINSSGTIPNATLTVTPTNETCLLSGDGSIDLSITGTNPGPFTYTWSNGATTQDAYNLSTNNYWVTIMDAGSNCMSLQSSISSIGINCGSISGNAYIDMNSDCSKNAGDNNLYNSAVIINPGNRMGYTNGNGDYMVNNLPYGTYSVSLNTYFGIFLPTCTTTLTTNVNGGAPNSINNNLSVGFNSSTNPDLKVYAYSNGIVPGFICFVNYSVSNLNNVSGTGLFKAVIPSAFIPNITSGTTAGYSISADTVIWNFSNITYAGGAQFFQIHFTVPLSTPLGSVFNSCAWAQPIITDFDPVNNTFCYSRIVTGSYDPNDKTVSPAGVGPNGDIAATVTDLTYLIRFQNTGNGPAVNIIVTDTLSSNVNVNTFEMLGSSHNYGIDILPGNVLRWKFNNIMLVDSGTNEPASHGHIQYRIKRTGNNTPGTQIKNIANIYFDFNAPVITNTAINTIETITGIQSLNTSNDQWLVYPNPSTGMLNIVNNNIAPDTKLKIEVINSFGQLVLEENTTANHKTLNMNNLSNGVYFVKIVSDKQSSVKRVVLSK